MQENNQSPDGKKLFYKMCSTCHAETTTKSGPPFQRVRQIRGKPWVYKFMKNAAYILTTDKQGKKLRKQFKYIMPSYMLSKEEIDAICDYVDTFPYNANSKHYKFRR
ncbi:MAG: c-type cytochrome [Flavisolibacter sp.]